MFTGLVFYDGTLPSFSSKIAAVPVYHDFVAGQQLRHHGNVMHVGGSHFNGVNQSAVLVCPDVCLVAEVPLIALLYLVRIRVTLLFLILGGGRSSDDG